MDNIAPFGTILIVLARRPKIFRIKLLLNQLMGSTQSVYCKIVCELISQ